MFRKKKLVARWVSLSFFHKEKNVASPFFFNRVPRLVVVEAFFLLGCLRAPPRCSTSHTLFFSHTHTCAAGFQYCPSLGPNNQPIADVSDHSQSSIYLISQCHPHLIIVGYFPEITGHQTTPKGACYSLGLR